MLVLLLVFAFWLGLRGELNTYGAFATDATLNRGIGGTLWDLFNNPGSHNSGGLFGFGNLPQTGPYGLFTFPSLGIGGTMGPLSGTVPNTPAYKGPLPQIGPPVYQGPLP